MPPSTRTPNHHRGVLLVILAAALALRLTGITFGLPNREHALTYNPDEWTPMRALQSMEPRKLDFNPHYYDNPTFIYYLYGAGFAVGHLSGWTPINGNERFYFEHPETLARMILLGRLYSVVFGTASVWLLYLLGRRLGLDRGVALLGSLLLAIHPSHIAQSKWMSVNSPVTFLHLAAFLMLERWIRRGDGSSQLAAGVVLGLALSSKYSALLLLPVVLAAAFVRALRDRDEVQSRSLPGRWSWSTLRPALQGAVVILAVAFATLAATSPYIFLASREATTRLSGFAATVPAWTSLADALVDLPRAAGFTLTVLNSASTPGLLLLAVLGGILLARGRRGFTLLVLGWSILFGLVTLRMGHLATDSRLLPLAPVLCLLAAVGLAAMYRRNRLVGGVTAGVLGLTVAGWSLIVLLRFLGAAPQQLASEWAQQNTQGHERVWIAGTGIYFSPDLVMREYNHKDNEANYERRTRWTFSPQNADSIASHAAGKRFAPDLVFVSLWRPSTSLGEEWLVDPDYQLAAAFPGKIHLFGRRVHPWLDIYDIDLWVLRRRDAR